MRFHLKIWRQKNPRAAGEMVDYEIDDIPPGASFLEMLDILNERLVERGEDPVEHDSDCREGICGTCSLVINGIPHGGQRGSATCQLHMRTFQDGDTIYVEPWRAKPFPVIKDLVVDRAPCDRIIQAGGYVSVRTGSPPDANALPRHGRRCVHRLRRLRGGVQKFERDAFHRREDFPSQSVAPRPSREKPARAQHGAADGQGRLRRLHQSV